jgi:hypothetical protein
MSDDLERLGQGAWIRWLVAPVGQLRLDRQAASADAIGIAQGIATRSSEEPIGLGGLLMLSAFRSGGCRTPAMIDDLASEFDRNRRLSRPAQDPFLIIRDVSGIPAQP